MICRMPWATVVLVPRSELTTVPSGFSTSTWFSSEFIAAEEIMLDYVKGPGDKKLDEFDARRNEFMEVVAKLKERVSRG